MFFVLDKSLAGPVAALTRKLAFDISRRLPHSEVIEVSSLDKAREQFPEYFKVMTESVAANRAHVIAKPTVDRKRVSRIHKAKAELFARIERAQLRVATISPVRNIEVPTPAIVEKRLKEELRKIEEPPTRGDAFICFTCRLTGTHNSRTLTAYSKGYTQFFCDTCHDAYWADRGPDLFRS